MNPSPSLSRPPRTGADPPFVVLMPVFDDWIEAGLLISRLDEQLATAALCADIVIVDDCSTTPAPASFAPAGMTAIRRIQVLRLKRNLGHQRALAVGLCFVSENLPGTDVIVMDADGEDLPSDVPRLVDAFRDSAGEQAVFARRIKRSEGILFSASYHLYRQVHRLLTGIPVEVGNFSIIPAAMLSQLTVSSELWNHYAATVVKLGIPRNLVDVKRGQRLGGRSKMSFVSLVAHGFGAMSVFADRIGVRLLISAAIVSALLVICIGGVISVRLFTDLAIPGWATSATGVLLILVTQLITAALILVIMVHQNRASASIVPARDAEVFVESVTNVHIPVVAGDVPGT